MNIVCCQGPMGLEPKSTHASDVWNKLYLTLHNFLIKPYWIRYLATTTILYKLIIEVDKDQLVTSQFTTQNSLWTNIRYGSGNDFDNVY